MVSLSLAKNVQYGVRATWAWIFNDAARSIKSPAPLEARPEEVGLERLVSQHLVELVV